LGRVDFVNIAKDSLASGLADYDVILLHGGNPFMIKKMLTTAFSPDFFSLANQLIISVSGSTCVLSPEFTLIKTFYPSWEGGDTSGLNLFPYEILPHYNRYRKKDQEIRRYSQHKTLYAIPDGAAVSYDGSNIELIGDVKIFEARE
jgi:peptidase E